MIVPIVATRMKEFCQGICFRIDPSQVSPFVKITIDASARLSSSSLPPCTFGMMCSMWRAARG